MHFNKKLFELRKQKGLSQEELANKVNVSRQTLSKWELGESTPDMEKLTLLSDYFGVSLDELVLGKEKENTDQNNLKNMENMLEMKIFTNENKKKMKKGLKIASIILLILLGIDAISLVVYLILYGFPK